MSWVFGALFGICRWVIWTYNGLVALRPIAKRLDQIDVQLKRRTI